MDSPGFKLGIDFHGVIANPEKITIKRAKQWYGISLSASDLTSSKAKTMMGSDYDYLIGLIETSNDLLRYRPNRDCAKVLGMLKSYGFGIFIVSSLRAESIHLGKEFLRSNDISYNGWISSEGRNKEDILRASGIDLLLDDDPATIGRARKKSIDAILFDRPTNQDDNVPNEHRVIGFMDFLDYVERNYMGFKK